MLLSVERLCTSFLQRLSPESIKILDLHVGFICKNNSRQSDREYPNIFTFSSGVSDATRLTAKEKFGRIFAIYLTLLTKDFENKIVGSTGRCIVPKKMEGKISSQEYKDWCNVFEQKHCSYHHGYTKMNIQRNSLLVVGTVQ